MTVCDALVAPALLALSGYEGEARAHGGRLPGADGARSGLLCCPQSFCISQCARVWGVFRDNVVTTLFRNRLWQCCQGQTERARINKDVSIAAVASRISMGFESLTRHRDEGPNNVEKSTKFGPLLLLRCRSWQQDCTLNQRYFLLNGRQSPCAAVRCAGGTSI